jgi:thymidylate kinase
MIDAQHNATSETLQALAEYWKARDVRWALLGRFDEPMIFANEVDIVIDESCLTAASEGLQQLVDDKGWFLVHVFRHERNSFAATIAQLLNGRWMFVAIDICTEFRFNGAFLQSADDLLRGRQAAASIPFVSLPSPDQAHRYYLLKCAAKKRWNSTARNYFLSLKQPDKAAIQKMLGEAFVDPLLNWLAGETEEPQGIPDAAFQRRYPVGVKGRVGEWRRFALRILKPTGLFVAVTGPDGAGKSTIAERVGGEICPCFRGITQSHLYKRLTPIQQNIPVAPYQKKPRGLVGSIAKLGVLILRFQALYWRWVFPSTLRHSLFWADRHYTDVIADPARFRVALPLAIRRAAWTLIPQPDLCFVLIASPETIQQRTSEIDLRQTTDQVESYEKLCRDHSHLRRCDANAPAALVASKVSSAIIEHLAERQRARGWMRF